MEAAPPALELELLKKRVDHLAVRLSAAPTEVEGKSFTSAKPQSR